MIHHISESTQLRESPPPTAEEVARRAGGGVFMIEIVEEDAPPLGQPEAVRSPPRREGTILFEARSSFPQHPDNNQILLYFSRCDQS